MLEKPIPETHINDTEDSENEHPSLEEIIIPADVINSTADSESLNNDVNGAVNPLDISADNSGNSTIIARPQNVSIANSNDFTDASLQIELNDSPNNISGDNNGERSASGSQPILNVSIDGLDVANGEVDENDNGDMVSQRVMDDDLQQGAQNLGPVASCDDNNAAPISHCCIAEKKPDVSEIFPIYEVRADNNEIMEELEERCVEILTFEGAEMEVTYKASKGFGKPFNATSDGLIKLEKPDPVSGMIPFITTVSY